MADFMIRFFICNLFISGIIGIFLIARQIFKNSLTNRMQYNLWFLLLGLLAVPFLPFRLTGFPRLFLWLKHAAFSPSSHTGTMVKEAGNAGTAETANRMNDFAVDLGSRTPSAAGYILCIIWITGILVMTIFLVKSFLRLRRIKKSALPLQNENVRRLYGHCLKEINITRHIPIYSTAFLTSPIVAGLFKPCIYVPIHFISDYQESEMRYILLHELQHYRHKDILSGYLMNLTGILYWFHPLVWYALRQMRSDKEIACDTSVLQMIEEDAYEEYGNTLINFAEKISLTPFPFTAGIGGNKMEIERRIINIAFYEKPTSCQKRKGITSFLFTAVLLLTLAPVLSTYAAKNSQYEWDSSSKHISYLELSDYFGTYEGSFVLYDMGNDSWDIYDLKHAVTQIAPNSTYKIYDALFGLEEGIISPENSLIAWDHEIYPFDAWNQDQTLKSAMDASVNWYFQALDEQLGGGLISDYIQSIGYGNEDISGDLSSYWLESSLKISPIEQVELLVKLYDNSFDFAPENISAVKDSIRLSTSESGTLYGKTGTGRVNGQDINGWFVGYVECSEHTCFFALNLLSGQDATGSRASQIALSILSDMGIWE